MKTVFFACFPGIFPPRGGETRTLCLFPPPLECFAAARRGFPGKANTFPTAILRPKPQNLFSGASLIGNTQGIGGVPGGHFPRRPAAVPGPKCDRSRCISARAGAGRPGAARPGPAAPGWAARSRPAKFAVRKFFHDFLAEHLFSRQLLFSRKNISVVKKYFFAIFC